MFGFVVNFWNVRHHTWEDKTSTIFFIIPEKNYAQEEKKPFMPIFIMISQHYHFRHHEFKIKCNVFLK